MLTHSEQDSTKRAWISGCDFPADQVANAHGMLLFIFIGEFDFVKLCLHKRILNLGPLDICQDLFGFFVTANLDKPSGRFRQPGRRCEEDDDEDELKGKWNPPSNLFTTSQSFIVASKCLSDGLTYSSR